MTTILSALYNINRTLEKRLRKSEWFYVLFIGVICLFLLSFGVLLYIVDYERTEYQFLFNLIAYMILMLDIGVVLMKFTETTVVEPKHLKVYPLSRWQKFKFHVALLLVDYKTFIYVTAIAITVFFLLIRSLYLEALFSIIIWLLLLASLISWTMVVYQLFGHFLHKYRNNAPLVVFFFAFFLLGTNLLGILELVNKVPLASYAGNALYGLMITDLYLIWNNVGFLLGSLFLGLLVYGFSPSNY